MTQRIGMPAYDLTFACVARNCAGTIANLFTSMRQLDARGVTSIAVIGENDSADGTRKLIEEQAQKGNVVLVDTSVAGRESNRLHRIALAREMVKDVLARKPWTSRFVCVADLDDVMSRPLIAAELSRASLRLDKDAGLFGVSATSAPWYYDLLAYRSDTLDFEGLEGAFAKAQTDPLHYYAFHRRNVYPAQKRITRLGSHLCRSAFNGVCIYRFAEFVEGSYLRDNGFANCEHLTFNASINRDGRRSIYVSQDFSIEMPTRHGPNGFFGFYLARTARYARSSISAVLRRR